MPLTPATDLGMCQHQKSSCSTVNDKHSDIEGSSRRRDGDLCWCDGRGNYPRRATQRYGYRSLPPRRPVSDQRRSGTIAVYCVHQCTDIAVPALPSGTKGAVEQRNLNQIPNSVQRQQVYAATPDLQRLLQSQIDLLESLELPPEPSGTYHCRKDRSAPHRLLATCPVATTSFPERRRHRRRRHRSHRCDTPSAVDNSPNPTAVSGLPCRS